MKYTSVLGIYGIQANIPLSGTEVIISNLTKIYENAPLLQPDNKSIVVPQDGIYIVLATFVFSANNLGNRQGTIYKNNTILLSRSIKSLSGTGNLDVIIPVFAPLVAGNTITFGALTNGGLNIQLLASDTKFMIYYLGK